MAGSQGWDQPQQQMFGSVLGRLLGYIGQAPHMREGMHSLTIFLAMNAHPEGSVFHLGERETEWTSVKAR
ncbi:hypothetical protein HYQ46_000431 [Verticillium longisporum]|nr:hypothetical protein HYQ46_000431 [Verticillium longisporum]